MGQKGEIFYDYCDPDKVKIKFTNKEEWEKKNILLDIGKLPPYAKFILTAKKTHGKKNLNNQL